MNSILFLYNSHIKWSLIILMSSKFLWFFKRPEIFFVVEILEQTRIFYSYWEKETLIISKICLLLYIYNYEKVCFWKKIVIEIWILDQTCLSLCLLFNFTNVQLDILFDINISLWAKNFGKAVIGKCYTALKASMESWRFRSFKLGLRQK